MKRKYFLKYGEKTDTEIIMERYKDFLSYIQDNDNNKYNKRAMIDICESIMTNVKKEYIKTSKLAFEKLIDRFDFCNTYNISDISKECFKLIDYRINLDKDFNENI